jgi:hypothetical protein
MGPERLFFDFGQRGDPICRPYFDAKSVKEWGRWRTEVANCSAVI